MDVQSLRPGPVRHPSLPDELVARVQAFHETLQAVDGFTLEERLDGFRRDVHPEREVAVWERLAGVYRAFCRDHSPSPEARKEAYRVLLLRSMASEEEVRRQLLPEHLSANQVAELFRMYRGDAHGDS